VGDRPTTTVSEGVPGVLALEPQSGQVVRPRAAGSGTSLDPQMRHAPVPLPMDGDSSRARPPALPRDCPARVYSRSFIVQDFSAASGFPSASAQGLIMKLSGSPAWGGSRTRSRPTDIVTRLLVWAPKK